MNPQLLAQILPWLKGMLGGGANTADPGTGPVNSGGQIAQGGMPYAGLPFTQQNIPPGGMGPSSPPQNLGTPYAGPASSTPTSTTGQANPLANNLNSYNAVMQALKGINPSQDGSGKQSWAPGFQFRSQAPAQSTVMPNPSVNAIGGLFTSPAGQQLLSNLRQYLQQGPQTPDIYGNA